MSLKLVPSYTPKREKYSFESAEWETVSSLYLTRSIPKDSSNSFLNYELA
jgi:hypothetical protein